MVDECRQEPTAGLDHSLHASMKYHAWQNTYWTMLMSWIFLHIMPMMKHSPGIG